MKVVDPKEPQEDVSGTGEACFRAVFESNPLGMVLVNLGDMRILQSNGSFCEMLGYTRRELQSLKISDITHPDDLAIETKTAPAALAADGLYRSEKRYITKHGAVIWGRLTCRLISEDKKTLALGMVQNITSQRQVIKQLRLSEFSLENAAIGVFWISPEGRFLYANKAGCCVSGYSRQELHQMRMSGVDIGQPQENRAGYWEMLKRQGVAVFKTQHRSRTGQIVPVEVTGHYLVFEGEEFEMAFVHDISESEATEEINRRYQEKLMLLAENIADNEAYERRRVVGYLHDHIAQNLGFCRIKLESARQQCPEQKCCELIREVDAFLEQCIAQTRTAISVLCPPVLEQLGFREAIKWLAGDFLQKHGLTVTIEVEADWPEKLPKRIEDKLFSAVRELLTNVVKHACVAAAEVIVRCPSQKLLEVEVRDFGAGFDLAVFRAKKSDSFGLFNIEQRLKGIGGRMDVTSEPSNGTRVTLRVGNPNTEKADPALASKAHSP